MTGKETKICEYCGKEIPITATKCKYCFNWVPDEVISRNHIPNNFTPEKPIYDNLDSEKWDKRSLGNKDKLTDKEMIGLLAIKFAISLNE